MLRWSLAIRNTSGDLCVVHYLLGIWTTVAPFSYVFALLFARKVTLRQLFKPNIECVYCPIESDISDSHNSTVMKVFVWNDISFRLVQDMFKTMSTPTIPVLIKSCLGCSNLLGMKIYDFQTCYFTGFVYDVYSSYMRYERIVWGLNAVGIHNLHTTRTRCCINVRLLI